MSRPDDIRTTAIRLFAKQGYRGTSMKDIAAALEIRAPSLYNHVLSKQEILREVMLDTMADLDERVQEVIATTDDVAEQLRRATVAHVLHHAEKPDAVWIGNREIPNLEEPARSQLLEHRRRYAHMWMQIIDRGIAEGRFSVASSKLATFAILEMGMGVSNWFDPKGENSAQEIAWHFSDLALGMVGASPVGATSRQLTNQR